MTAAIRHQRTTGTAEVVLCAGRPQRLFQRGSAKAIWLGGPRPEVVFLNTSGGLTGGDTLSYALHTDGDTLATTQTAERAYRSASDNAVLDLRLSVTQGRLVWLPQETILFDASSLRRRTRIDLGPLAEVLSLETLVLGRSAMGESLGDFALSDTRQITRAGRPVHLEPLHLTPATLNGPATLAGARALASLVLIAPGAADALAPVRAVLDGDGVRAAASAVDGRLVVRLMADDLWPLKRQILRLLAALLTPLPRVWQT